VIDSRAGKKVLAIQSLSGGSTQAKPGAGADCLVMRGEGGTEPVPRTERIGGYSRADTDQRLLRTVTLIQPGAARNAE